VCEVVCVGETLYVSVRPATPAAVARAPLRAFAGFAGFAFKTFVVFVLRALFVLRDFPCRQRAGIDV
jgi:hypothetical protein